MRIRIVTYSTKPRGGVVHALSLAEALLARGNHVELWALSVDGAGLFRPTEVPARFVPVGRRDDESVRERILRYAEALADGLRAAGPADVHHAEDCLSARSLLALRAEGHLPAVIRTVHHVDEFDDPVLEECQRASIEDVDVRISVSGYWAGRLREDFGVDAQVIPNGVNAERYAARAPTRAAAGARMGWGSRPTVLAVGGVEPRKGSVALLRAFAVLRELLGVRPLLAIAGGETLFDYSAYREGWRREAARLGLRVEQAAAPSPRADVIVMGRVDDELMPTLYRAADVLAFPSRREGFGLVVLEALAAGTPAVVSDLPVLREYLRDGRDCLMVPVDAERPLVEALAAAIGDGALRRRLIGGGRATAARHTWAAAAAAHERVYGGVGVAA